MDKSIGSINRNYSFDILKMLCAFLVVCIHAPFSNEFGEYVKVLARIAVPVFFMISGYFWQSEKTAKQLVKLTKLMIFANALYFLLELVKSALISKDIISYLSNTFSLTNIFKFIVLNVSPFAPHLWYLSAAIYVYFVFWLAKKMNLVKLIYIFSPILLICDLIIGKYSLLFFHREFPYIIVRNWLFVGIPYFAIGCFIKSKNEFIKKRFKILPVSCGIAFFALSSLLERFLLVKYDLNATRDHYLSTTFLSVCVFIMFLIIVSNDSFISRLGRTTSSGIYIYHYLVYLVLEKIISKIHISNIYNTIRPIIVFLLTTVFCFLIVLIKKHFKIRRQS